GAWRAVPPARGNGVDDPVGADLARIVEENRDAGLRPGTDNEDRRVGVTAGELLVGADEQRARRGERGTVHVLEAQVAQLEEAHDERSDLVAGALRLGGDTPVLDQLVRVVDPQPRPRGD